MDGYIKLHRKILDNPVVCKDSDYFAVWGYLLLNATHKECPAMFRGEKIILKPGQLLTGRKSISRQFKVDESKVQRVLKKLEIEQQIEQQTSNENRLITILNWSDYQQGEQQNELPVNNECTTDEQRVNTNKNVKNVKNINKDIHQEYKAKFLDGSFEMKCVKYLISSIRTEMPDPKLPDTDKELDKWCDNIEKMVRLDKRTNEDIYNTLVYARTDAFWKINIRSTSKFREKYETLYLQMKNKRENKPQQQPQKTNSFNNYSQRVYTAEDYAEIERASRNRLQEGK